jgi:hypothetical protein
MGVQVSIKEEWSEPILPDTEEGIFSSVDFVRYFFYQAFSIPPEDFLVVKCFSSVSPSNT